MGVLFSAIGVVAMAALAWFIGSRLCDVYLDYKESRDAFDVESMDEDERSELWENSDWSKNIGRFLISPVLFE